MTKYVFTNDMCIHVWAQQNQSDGRNGKDTVRFRGTTLYSYSTPIANFVTDKDGNKVVLLSHEHYSTTTSEHINTARASASQYPQFNVDILLRDDDTDRTQSHLKNINGMIKRYRDSIARLGRTTKEHIWENKYLKDEYDAFRDYGKRFDIELTEWPDIKADWAKLGERWDRLKAERNTPQYIERARKRRERKEAKMREQYRTLQGDFGPQWRASWKREAYFADLFTREDSAIRNTALGDHYKEKLELYRIGDESVNAWDIPSSLITDEIEFARNAAVRERHINELAAWRNGETLSISCLSHVITDEDRAARDAALRQQPIIQDALAGYLRGEHTYAPRDIILTDEEEVQYNNAMLHKHERDIELWRAGKSYNTGSYRTGRALLRVYKNEVQTSLGATFPAEHAIKAYHLLKMLHDAGKTYHRNGHSIHLGHFVVDAFENGIVRAGCHTVEWTEVENCAKLLGIA